MPRDRQPRPTEVAELLTQLREAAGLSTNQVADALKISQGTIGHIEHGRIVPNRALMTSLIEQYRPDTATAERLVNLARDAKPKHRRVVLHRSDAPRYQREYGELEREAAVIRNFTATCAPGLLQTDEYARALVGDQLTGTARDRWIAERRRRRELVANPDRALQFVTTTGALAWNLGGVAVMRGQLDRLAEVSRLEHVALGIITPAAVATEVVVNNVDLYQRADGRHTVVIGTSAGTSLLTDGREIALHAALLDRLAGLAVWGDEARAALEEIATWYRGTPQ